MPLKIRKVMINGLMTDLKLIVSKVQGLVFRVYLSFLVQPLNPEPLYETTPKWHGFFLDQTGCLQPAAGLNAEPRA